MLSVPNHPQTFKEIMIVGFSLWKQGLKKVLLPVGLSSFLGIILLYVLGLFFIKSTMGYFSGLLKSGSYLSILSMLDGSEPQHLLKELSTVAEPSSWRFFGWFFSLIAGLVSLGTIIELLIFSVPLAFMIFGMHRTFTDPSSIKEPRFFDSPSLSISDLFGYNLSYKRLFLFPILCFLSNLIIVLGFICFFVPGLIAFFALFFAPYLFITGDYTMWGSIKASANLFSKDRWLIVKRLSVFILVALFGSSFLLTTRSSPSFNSIPEWACILLFSSVFHACALSLLHDIQLRKMDHL